MNHHYQYRLKTSPNLQKLQKNKQITEEFKKRAAKNLYDSYDKASQKHWDSTPFIRHQPHKVFNGTKIEFHKYLEENVMYVENPVSQSIFMNFFSRSFIENPDGVYYERHLPKKYNGKIHYIIVYPHSSEQWWDNIEKIKYDEYKFIYENTPNDPVFSLIHSVKYFQNLDLGLWARMIEEHEDPDEEYEEIWNLQTFNNIPVLEKRRKNFTGCHEIHSSDVWLLKNTALYVEGWDPFDPPFQIVSLGGPAGLPRFTSDTEMGEGCLVKFECTDGVVTSYEITKGGAKHKVRDVLEIKGANGETATILVLDVDENGAITDSELTRGGSGYKPSRRAVPALHTKSTTICGTPHKHPDLFLFPQKGFGNVPSTKR